jgi:hypothetical protein
MDKKAQINRIEPEIHIDNYTSTRVVYFSDTNRLVAAHLGTLILPNGDWGKAKSSGHTFIFDHVVFFNKTANYVETIESPPYGLIYEYTDSPLLQYFQHKKYRHFILLYGRFEFRDIVATSYEIIEGVTGI